MEIEARDSRIRERRSRECKKACEVGYFVLAPPGQLVLKVQ